MAWYFGFFVISGFCSLVYEVVWLRLAMAGFGVTTPFVSIVLSVFMAGLALGSWAAGRLTRWLGAVPPRRALRLYAAVEAVIGVSGIAVPGELGWGRAWLGERAVAWDSSTYYLASGAWIALTLLPYCIAMGATFPLAMAAMRSLFGERAKQSFSYLYVANVLGATAGTIGSALVLIELFGFRGTLLVAASLNGLLAASALALSFGLPANAPLAPGATARRDRIAAPAAPTDRTAALACLFLTGLISMGLEVVWIRQFTPYLGTVVYTFAGILGVYLVATLVGSRLYRSVQGRGDAQSSAWAASIWMLFGLSALLPMATTDPRVPLPGEICLVLGIAPFCIGAGFVTPMLVDRRAGSDPDRAGRAYAVNVIGCILGPLLAGFWLLPWLGERWSLVALSLPLFALGLVAVIAPQRLVPVAVLDRVRAATLFGAALIASVILLPLSRSFETQFPDAQVRRDHTATVVAAGTGLHKHLLVNGQGTAALRRHPAAVGAQPRSPDDRLDDARADRIVPVREGLQLRRGLGRALPGANDADRLAVGGRAGLPRTGTRAGGHDRMGPRCDAGSAIGPDAGPRARAQPAHGAGARRSHAVRRPAVQRVLLPSLVPRRASLAHTRGRDAELQIGRAHV